MKTHGGEVVKVTAADREQRAILQVQRTKLRLRGAIGWLRDDVARATPDFPEKAEVERHLAALCVLLEVPSAEQTKP